MLDSISEIEGRVNTLLGPEVTMALLLLCYCVHMQVSFDIALDFNFNSDLISTLVMQLSISGN